MKRACGAVALALFALASCRQIVGFDDRATTHDAGTSDAAPESSTTIPVVLANDCPTEDAAFCDDFDDTARDAGWTTVLDHPPENDGGAAGTITIEPPGNTSAPNGLRVVYAAFRSDNDQYRFNNARWGHGYPAASFVELTFSIRIKAPIFPTSAAGNQIALLTLPTAAVFPSIEPDGRLHFGWSTKLQDGAASYPNEESLVSFSFDTWHKFSVSIDTQNRLMVAKIDDQEAFRKLYDSVENAGGFEIALGQRTPFFGSTTPLDVSYDDVIVRTR